MEIISEKWRFVSFILNNLAWEWAGRSQNEHLQYMGYKFLIFILIYILYQISVLIIHRLIQNQDAKPRSFLHSIIHGLELAHGRIPTYLTNNARFHNYHNRNAPPSSHAWRGRNYGHVCDFVYQYDRSIRLALRIR